MFNKIILISLMISLNAVSGAIQCRDQNNQPVDWYVLFKLPKIQPSSKLLSNGEAYMYITSDTLDQGWTWSTIGIQDENTLLANTLRPYYDIDTKASWVLYNDQNPKYGKFIWFLDGGHTKGVVGADDKGGFWLVHSVPKYPPGSNAGYGYPGTGFTHGQSALCMSLTPYSINNVGKSLGYNNANVYDLKIGPNMNNLYPDLLASAENNFSTQFPWYFKTDLQTIGGNKFTVFAKDKNFKKDLYELVAQELKTDLLVESWQNVFLPLRSSCSGNFKVMNIKEITVQENNISFESKHDHSKWAVGNDSPWTCIGDINRAKHQEKRGGGTVCFENKLLWSLYHKTVVKVEDC